MAMQKRLEYYEKLTREEARMIQEALGRETQAYIIEIKHRLEWLKEDKKLIYLSKKIDDMKEDLVPYHRLLHGPEIEIAR